MDETVSITGTEIFQSGTWNNDFYSNDDLDSMVTAFDQVGFKPPIKIGHAAGQEKLQEEQYRKIFGAPSLGFVSKIYRIGNKLLADFIDIPKHFAELIKKKAYSRISSEIYWDYKDEAKGNVLSRVLKAVSFLGSDIPAITSLKDVQALYKKTAGGALFAYEGTNEFRVYDYMGGPKKDKASTAYRLVGGEDNERCATCRFYQMGSCSVVEGEIEPYGMCDLYEHRTFSAIEENRLLSKFKAILDSSLAVFKEHKDKVRSYMIEKVGDEWCVKSEDGETLGCHDTEEGAKEQLKAVEASKNSSKKEILVTVAEMAKLCSPCADKMKQKKITAIKLTSKNDGKTYDLPSNVTDDMVVEFSTHLSADIKPELAQAIREKMKTIKVHNKGGGAEMTEKEVQEMIEKAKADSAKEYEEKLEAAKADITKSFQEGKAAAEKEYKDQLEANSQKVKELETDRRKEKIANRLAALSAKIPRPWKGRLQAIFEYMPEEAVHSYSGADGKEVKESVAETLWQLFENAPEWITKQFTREDPLETSVSGDPQIEVSNRAKKFMKDNGEKSLSKAISQVLKDDPTLAQSYDESVKGVRH